MQTAETRLMKGSLRTSATPAGKEGDRLRLQVLEALKEIAPEIDDCAIDPDVAYHDQYEFDSVDFLSFVRVLEKRLATKVPELDYPKLATLNGCVSYFTVDTRNP